MAEFSRIFETTHTGILGSIADTIPALIAYVDAERRYRFVNRQYEAWFGRPLAEIEGKLLWEIVGEEAYGKVEPHVERALAGVGSEIEAFVPYPTGHRHIHAAFIPQFEQGQVVGYFSLITDVTERARTDELLRASEERYRVLVNASSDVAYRMSADWAVMEPLDGRGLVPSNATPKLDWMEENLPHSEHAKVREAISIAIRNKQTFELEHRVNRADGTIGWTFSRAVPILNAAGNIIEWFGTARDVNDRKKVEEERERLVCELRDAHRRKDEFLATLAHELRNPLSPIKSGVSILRMSNPPVANERVLAMIERQLGQLVHLVDDLLDVSRVTSGKIELRIQRIDIRTILESAIETSRALIEAARHSFQLQIRDEPLLLDGDPTRLTQVFTNLLNNAAKYTPDGGRIRMVAERSGRELSVKIEDSGVGIPADMLARVFEVFTQVGQAIDRSQGGMGLGLALVKKLVEMHGGTVAATSDGAGMGSCFTIRLPLVDQ